MKKTLFITGASGFVGTQLLERLPMKEYEEVYCLCRKENKVIQRLLRNSHVKFIKADLSDVASYSRYLYLSDVVVHLAAVTGKARADEYFRVNSRGTKILLEQCKNGKGKQFLYISSIAVNFDNIKNYYYAQSKRQAEQHVMTGGIPYTILRPTMVIGKGSPILNAFLALTQGPVVPIFGDGSVKIQPIYIDDLIDGILTILSTPSLTNEVLTAAGPEQITMEEFIKILHGMSSNKRFRPVHLPVRPIANVLSFLEKFLLPFLPLTAGQLASFTNSGIAEQNVYRGCQNSRPKNIDEMLTLSTHA